MSVFTVSVVEVDLYGRSQNTFVYFEVIIA